MKKLIIGTMLLATSMSIFADIDLRNGFNGKPAKSYLRTLKAGQRVSIDLGRSQYVEELLIFAEGRQSRFSFGKVYADGQEISTLGVPGFDPDYPVVVRGNVRRLEVVASANSKFKILDFKVFTTRKNYNSYHRVPMSQRANFSLDNWGKHTLDAVYELYYIMRDQGLISQDDFLTYIQPIKRAAVRTQASDNARAADSLKTYRKARELADALVDAQPIFDKVMSTLDRNLDSLAIDLMTIKEDISEKYDIDLEDE
ncbi:hypothetical protein A9Q84_04450 [Halobacteriovorax marinus]|uniref:DUF4369 domain-containing protein n=1 Tax=Halobacteriovorax marinus TaxID=97084 RepID=A0A1Y5FAF3_9BACT|nr:hypothetical protein A9Q84_04450 [Halobacteriovorax marinus]